MHVHVPKPLHGWKAFANEIVIIVIGVLIALGFEQVVEEIHWRHKVEDGEERLRTETGIIFSVGAELVIAKPCVLAQLQRLREHIEASGPEMAAAPLYSAGPRQWVLRTPARTIGTSVWESLQQDGTAAHLDAVRQRYLGQFYAQAGHFMQLSKESVTTRDDLMMMGHAMPLDPATRGTLLRLIAEEEGRTWQAALLISQDMGTLRDIGMAPDPARVDAYLARLERTGGTVAFCKAQGLPLGDWRQQLAQMPTIAQRTF